MSEHIKNWNSSKVKLKWNNGNVRCGLNTYYSLVLQGHKITLKNSQISPITTGKSYQILHIKDDNTQLFHIQFNVLLWEGKKSIRSI